MAESVTHDLELTLAAKVVFNELALWSKPGGIVSRGQRSIAEALGLRQATVGLALRALERRGHIAITGAGQQRRVYQLKSWVYREQRQKTNRRAAA